MTLSWSVIPAPGPIGALTVGVTGAGLALVVFGDAPGTARRAADRRGGPLGGDAGATGPVARELAGYLAGTRTEFGVPLDWSLTAGSQRRVLEALHTTVGYGATVTYGELAARSGLAHTGARGVGAIMGSNPLPVVVPCHRVLASDGLGGFGGGRATKEWLLALEGVLTPSLFD